ncbi:uncharacterized protein [Mobula birostris]|uniref:uncharacterized protein isoform X3 n=1 Tax=Mobula birostris TaxID=1983395 RepID=UPI003B28BF19
MSSNGPEDKKCVSQWPPQLSTGTGFNTTTLINQQGWGDCNDQLRQSSQWPHSRNNNMSNIDCCQNTGQHKKALDLKQTQQTNSSLFQGHSGENQSQTLHIGQVQPDKANGLLDPIINNELNQLSILYSNVQQQVQSRQPEQLMRQQMEQVQQLMEQQQKLIKLLSWPMAHQGFTLPVGFAPPWTGISAGLLPGNNAMIQFSSPSAKEDSTNVLTQASFPNPLVETAQSTKQLNSSTSANGNHIQTAIHPHLSQGMDDSTAEYSVLTQCSANEKPNSQVSRQKSQVKEPETSVDECILEHENYPGNLSPINEEKAEQGEEQRVVTPFGIKTNSKEMGRLEERPIRPGIDEKQKTFEDFVEEQLKVDSELFQQDSQVIWKYQLLNQRRWRIEIGRLGRKRLIIPLWLCRVDINEVKVAPKKSFLKRGEGIARFEKNKENILKEQKRNPDHESVDQLPKKVRFCNQRRLSLPSFNEYKKLQINKQSALKKQVSSLELVESKTKKFVSTSSSITNSKRKELKQKEKQDEIKNSTDEGIQSDINVPELSTKVESPCKYSNERNSGSQRIVQESTTGDVRPVGESQGRANASKDLSLHILERQQLIRAGPESQSQTNSSVSHGSVERQSQGQEVEQNVANSLQGSSNDQPPFNSTNQQECPSMNKSETLDWSTELPQEQSEQKQNNLTNIKDPRKMQSGKGPNIGFKKVNDKIVQVTSDNLPCHRASFRTQEGKDHNMHSFANTGLIPLVDYKHSMHGYFKSNNEHCGVSNVRAYGVDPDSNGLNSQLQQPPTDEILHNSVCSGRSLDLSDDADYASDAPSGTEELGMAFQNSQHFTDCKSTAGMAPVKCNTPSSTTSSESETSDLKPPSSRRYPSQYNRPTRNKTKTARKKLNFAKKNISNFVANEKCGTQQSDLVQLSCHVLAQQLSPALSVAQNASKTSDHSHQMKTNSGSVQEDAQSRKLQEKLLQLETEIDRFKAENTALAKLKEEQVLALESLRKRMDQFEYERTEKITQLEATKKEELKKLMEERQLSEKNSQAKVAFDKRDHEAMELLKKQVGQLQEELKRNESRWSFAHNYLRSQIDTLTKENFELRDELKAVECHQLEPVIRNEPAILTSSKSETPVFNAMIRSTSQTAQWSHRSRSSTPNGRRVPLERSQTPVNTEPKISESMVKRAEIQKRQMQEIQGRPPIRLRSRSATPTGWKTPLQERPTTDQALSKPPSVLFNEVNMSIQQPISNHQKAQEGKLSTPRLNQSVFQRNTAGLARGSSEDNLCKHLQTTEHMPRSQSYTTKQQGTKALIKSTVETPSRLQERPPSGRRSRSTTPSGRKTPLDGKQIGFDIEQKVSRPSSVLSRRESACFKSNITQDDVREEIQYPDGKMEQILTNGNRIIIFRNGTRKEVSADGQSVTITFFNGDVKQFMPDQTVIYYYADAKTTHTTFPSGIEMLQFSNNQIEKHYPDGKKEIIFPDQTIKHLFPDGHEKSIFPDGTVVNLQKNGDKIIEFNNGQREIHTPQYKRREYPDGTKKTVYPNGRQETKYSTGRVRIKDKKGNLVLDKM